MAAYTRFLLQACSSFKYVKHQINGLDSKKFTYKYSVVEGDALSDIVENQEIKE